MGTLGDTTSRNLASVVRAANSGGGNAPAVGGKYHGGFSGGGGSFGRAPSGRGDPPPRASGAGGSSVRGPLLRSGGNTGVRPKVRPNSEGVKALWDTLEFKELPKAPAKGASNMLGSRVAGSSTQLRPKSASQSTRRYCPLLETRDRVKRAK